MTAVPIYEGLNSYAWPFWVGLLLPSPTASTPSSRRPRQGFLPSIPFHQTLSLPTLLWQIGTILCGFTLVLVVSLWLYSFTFPASSRVPTGRRAALKKAAAAAARGEAVNTSFFASWKQERTYFAKSLLAIPACFWMVAISQLLQCAFDLFFPLAWSSLTSPLPCLLFPSRSRCRRDLHFQLGRHDPSYPKQDARSSRLHRRYWTGYFAFSPSSPSLTRTETDRPACSHPHRPHPLLGRFLRPLRSPVRLLSLLPLPRLFALSNTKNRSLSSSPSVAAFTGSVSPPRSGSSSGACSPTPPYTPSARPFSAHLLSLSTPCRSSCVFSPLLKSGRGGCSAFLPRRLLSLSSCRTRPTSVPLSASGRAYVPAILSSVSQRGRTDISPSRSSTTAAAPSWALLPAPSRTRPSQARMSTTRSLPSLLVRRPSFPSAVPFPLFSSPSCRTHLPPFPPAVIKGLDVLYGCFYWLIDRKYMSGILTATDKQHRRLEWEHLTGLRSPITVVTWGALVTVVCAIVVAWVLFWVYSV